MNTTAYMKTHREVQNTFIIWLVDTEVTRTPHTIQFVRMFIRTSIQIGILIRLQAVTFTVVLFNVVVCGFYISLETVFLTWKKGGVGGVWGGGMGLFGENIISVNLLEKDFLSLKWIEKNILKAFYTLKKTFRRKNK